MQTVDDKFKKYSKTDLFRVVDSMGVPHPFVIGTKHVVHASDNFSGMLGKEAIKDLESKKGHSCYMKGCTLMFEEHEQALLVEVNSDEELITIQDELNTYLKSIVDLSESEGYAGFCFIKKGG